MKTLINRYFPLVLSLFLLTAVSAQAQVNYDKITYIHSDASGTPIAASDEQGDIVWSIEHYPYGAEYSNDANNRGSTLSFAGKAYDEETGLSYFGGRWYNAHIGRFMGIDPAPVDSEDWRTFNRYSYGFNNPYKYLDPDGWEPIDPHADTDGDGMPNFAEASYVKVDNVLGTGLNVSQGTLSIGIGMANGKVSDVLKGNATKGGFSNVAPATAKQLQKKFKHASDFGVEGNFNSANAKKFNQAIQNHLNAEDTKQITGTYRGNPITFHTNPKTGLTVLQNPNGSFLSGWKLNPQQLQHVLKDGKL